MARPPAAAAERPIVTLTTDFGTRDHYVAAMKGVLVRNCPAVRLIDVTHQVPPQDILCGSISLERAVDGFPPGTIHLAIVDPGVGSDRRILIAELNRQTVICPDNGLITWAWRRMGPGRAYELTWRPAESSHTFHGRDVMAPAAAMLACGKRLRTIARPIEDPVLLDIAPAASSATSGTVLHVDQFGNATTNIDRAVIAQRRGGLIKVRGQTIGKLRRTYWDVAPGKPIALIGSSGLLEIAIRDGSAARKLRLRVGDEVRVE